MSDSDSDGGAPPAPMVEVKYKLNEEVEVPNTNGKLFKTVLVEGTAGTKPPKGAKVSVHYVGTLLSDGSKFDSSRDRGELFEFPLGQGQVIKGWDQGVATMNKGEKCILKCLPEYAYGAAGSPPKIPANSTLNFEVELFEWTKSEDVSEKKDKSIMKSVIVEGTGWDKPDFESAVQCSVAVLPSVKDAATPIEQCKDYSMIVGETDVIPGLEQTIKSMKKGETCIVEFAGSVFKHPPAPNALFASYVQPGKPLILQLALTEFTKIKTWEVKGKDKVEEGRKRKDQGNAYFAQKDFAKAQAKYKRSLEFVEHDYGLEGDDKEEAKKVKLAAWSNLAQVCLNANDPKECISFCNKVLEVDEKNLKALYRRGKAHNALDNWEEGKADLTALLQIDQSNSDAARELELINQKIRQQLQKEKKVFGSLFERMSALEAKEQAIAAQLKAKEEASKPKPPPAEEPEAQEPASKDDEEKKTE